MRFWSEEEKENVNVVFDTKLKSKRKYRYYFEYAWSESSLNKITTLIMLNPSKTDEDVVDPTIDKCINAIHRHLNCKAVIIVNLYPWITPKPTELFKLNYKQISGGNKNNMEIIEKSIAKSDYAILAWGKDGEKFHMNHKVLRLLEQQKEKEIMCFGETKFGHPVHPGRLPDSMLIPQPFKLK
ncbi:MULTISPECIES: DUF1643 domain-containing protein [unclassified Paenibacillus]|uniref:DUF1643 domain-containing protein n=1 Tax=unclassified Paenibacillus TaxID=185978 RepID=UPI000FADB0B4|nr:DUF1643 domain-containing protein [Paenibacillus sp. 1182]MBP1172894.1 hypothetical protein [Paenibacillus sp. PvR133]MBP1310377.1 hypothetical protein [Paenibacillus sp. 1182]